MNKKVKTLKRIRLGMIASLALVVVAVFGVTYAAWDGGGNVNKGNSITTGDLIALAFGTSDAYVPEALLVPYDQTEGTYEATSADGLLTAAKYIIVEIEVVDLNEDPVTWDITLNLTQSSPTLVGSLKIALFKADNVLVADYDSGVWDDGDLLDYFKTYKSDLSNVASKPENDDLITELTGTQSLIMVIYLDSDNSSDAGKSLSFTLTVAEVQAP